MTKLEQLAASAFERYARLTTGRPASWTYLAQDRKEAWMKEMIFFIEHISDRLKAEFKAPPRSNPNAGAYAAGYADGMATERLSITNFIEQLDTKYVEDLEYFKAVNAEKKRRSNLTSE
jgi:hypothetical protein